MVKEENVLLEPIKIGDWECANRVLMAPLTRCRASDPYGVPSELAIEYYRQRASAGLIVTEASQVSRQGKGYLGTPGIYSDEQVEAWKPITEAVHQAGGLIVLQLWHVGRVSHPDLQENGEIPVSASAIGIEGGQVTVSPGIKKDSVVPRALETGEIPGIIEQFRHGAQCAKDAGFDGVEIHGANGYLLDQFTRSGTNHRTDAYGGSAKNRVRLPLEIAQAVVGVWGPGRVGYRISPTGEFGGMHDEDPVATFSALVQGLGKLGLAYLHAVEAFRGGERDDEILMPIVQAWKQCHTGNGVYIGNGAYTGATARTRVEEKQADAIAFGELFIANPDLPKRIDLEAPLNEPDSATYYTNGAEGYVDYPSLDEAEAGV
ncbi:MAG: alkene reductase [Planctomycetota bacterium]